MKTLEQTIAKREEDRQARQNKTQKTYKVMGVTARAWWCVPIIPLAVAVVKIDDWLRYRDTWSNRKADRVIMAKLAKSAVLKEDGTISYCMRDWGHWFYTTAKLIDRPFAKKYNYDIANYLKNEFELKGYTKTVEPDECDDEWTYVIFKKN